MIRLERRLLGAAPHPYCLCPSRRVKDDLERWYGVPSELIEILPYGVDLGRFDDRESMRGRVRSERGVGETDRVVLFVGDDFGRKGLDRAILGLARSTSGGQLWVVGGNNAAINRAAAVAASAGIGGRIRFLGRLSMEELAALYCAVDIVLLPTTQDSWALPVVEGLAAGAVVVASEHAGSCEVIEHGLDGFVLDGEGSAEEIAAYLDGPLAKADVRTAVSARARVAARRFDQADRYRRYREAHFTAYELAMTAAGPPAALAIPASPP